MKSYGTKIILFSLICTAPIIADSCCTRVTTHINPRSLSVNLPRTLSGTVNLVNLPEQEGIYSVFSVAPGYTQTFRPDSIAQCLFGNTLQCDCKYPTINISGSRVEDRGSSDWLADYFGLSTDYQGSITFKPRIKNFFIDLSLYAGLDEWMQGAWLRVWAPFVNTRWNLGSCETCVNNPINGYDEGYFSDEAVSNDNLLCRAKEFFQQRKTPNLGNSFEFEPLESCRWSDCECDGEMSKSGVADVRFALGWNFLQNNNYHIGIGIVAAAPAGNVPEGTFLFQPILGNGNHAELGALWTSHLIFWNSEDETKHIGGYLDANITHLFKSTQKRCFDLCGKPLSRYMLAEKLGNQVSASYDLWSNDAPVTNTDATKVPSQFKNMYAPVANLTCADVDVSATVQADVVAMLNYTSNGFSWDLGYNFWIRSCEDISFNCRCLPRLKKENDTWALKGDAYTYGFGASNANDTNFRNSPLALSATQSNATICSGTNFVSDYASSNQNKRNFGVDNAQYAMFAAPDSSSVADGSNVLVYARNTEHADGANQSKTSNAPKFINECDIDLNSAKTKGLSHSAFTSISYTWADHENWVPFFGGGAQAEFSAKGSKDCNRCTSTSCDSTNSNPCYGTSNAADCKSCCDSCLRCSMSQWYVWIKGGVSFN